MKMSSNGASTIFGHSFWEITPPIGCSQSSRNFWLPLLAKQIVIPSLPHHENKCQWRINGGVSSSSGFGTALDGPVRVVTQRTQVPSGFRGRFEPDRSLTLRFLQLCLKLSIWVLIVSWYCQYVNCSALAALLPPAFRFAIWLIFVEWLWNNGWI
jgi:hypothetical protein